MADEPDPILVCLNSIVALGKQLLGHPGCLRIDEDDGEWIVGWYPGWGGLHPTVSVTCETLLDSLTNIERMLRERLADKLRVGRGGK